jgi:hypothetical protein
MSVAQILASLSVAVIFTHLSIGFGVRLGTTEVSNPSASASADLLKFAFIIYLSKKPKKLLEILSLETQNIVISLHEVCVFLKLF